jgi:uncharacterized protein (TIGR02118 family)
MTMKLVVLYAKPDDPEAFAERYRTEHAPLVAAIPGLQRFESGPIAVALDGGEHTYHWMAELYFENQPAMDAAFGSPEGQATAQHYGAIAPANSRMFVQVLD